MCSLLAIEVYTTGLKFLAGKAFTIQRETGSEKLLYAYQSDHALNENA